MLTTSRRLLVLAALFFWQGGFTFYAAVVVPVGQQELHSHRRQGFITRRVTPYLNLSGLVALLPLAWDTLSARDPARWRLLARAGLFALMALTLLALFAMHGWLDELLVVRGGIVTDPEEFRPRHRLYLWTSTVQWAAAIAYLVLTLGAWQGEDRGQPAEVSACSESEKSAEAGGIPR
jgi:hypothetical protein